MRRPLLLAVTVALLGTCTLPVGAEAAVVVLANNSDKLVYFAVAVPGQTPQAYRIAAGDDEEEEEEEQPAPEAPRGDITPKRSDEWTCEQCFFIVSTSQFGSKDSPRCPQGEDPCPSITRAFG